MVTILFTPRMYQGFSFTRAELFKQHNINQLPIIRGSLILYNAIVRNGPLDNISDIKVILNQNFNLYEVVCKHLHDQVWATDFRNASPNEISDVYDTVVTAIHYLTTDIFDMIKRCFPTAPVLHDISIQGTNGYLYV